VLAEQQLRRCISVTAYRLTNGDCKLLCS